MPDAILRTKLHRPGLPSDCISRPRLHDRLNAGLAGPLTLITAPAGYGKTTLVSQWLEGRPEKSAWLSLDESDADALALLRCMVAAVQSTCPAACSETHALLQEPNQPPVSVLVRSLINELDAIPERLILILDDYHALREPEAHELVRAILQHPPRSLHLLICTRRDPPLNLAVLRAQNHVKELRLTDLAFTESETDAFLTQVFGQSVGSRAVANTQRQFEGWAVGLRLAALAVRGRDRPEEFLAHLRGELKDVRDYLIEEVVARQPAEMQTWLRNTSVLGRFNARLCEHLCAGDSGSSIDGDLFMRNLERDGLFAIALGPEREWYRFHAIFRELLHRQLTRSVAPEVVDELHRRASAWFAEAGLNEDAIEHALATGDLAAAAKVVENARQTVLKNGQWHHLERWMSLLPDELTKTRPQLLMAQAWTVVCPLAFAPAVGWVSGSAKSGSTFRAAAASPSET
jgi:LuxR family maltose regulon positive regulatory protein